MHIMSTTKRLQLFLNRDIHAALKEYAKNKFGPNSRNTSAIVQSFIIEALRKEGFWPPKTEWKAE